MKKVERKEGDRGNLKENDEKAAEVMGSVGDN